MYFIRCLYALAALTHAHKLTHIHDSPLPVFMHLRFCLFCKIIFFLFPHFRTQKKNAPIFVCAFYYYVRSLIYFTLLFQLILNFFCNNFPFLLSVYFSICLVRTRMSVVLKTVICAR